MVSWLALAGATAWRFRPRPRHLPRGTVSKPHWSQALAAAGRRRRSVLQPIRNLGASKRRDSRLARELPEAVDLLLLAVGAGLTVPLAVEAVARRLEGLVGEAFAAARSRSRLGEPLADALESLPELSGEPLRQLVRPLVASLRYGVELLPPLESLAADVRLQRRRQAETAARKLPVKLLFPLVLCILPAFALLTVVPAIASSLRNLQL